jgi:arabinose-5-phosphate isomerase
LERPIAELMTRRPSTIASGAPLREAIEILRQRKISELPVVDAAGVPLGLIDLTDVVGLPPEDADFAQAERPYPAVEDGGPNVLIYPNSAAEPKRS